MFLSRQTSPYVYEENSFGILPVIIGAAASLASSAMGLLGKKGGGAMGLKDQYLLQQKLKEDEDARVKAEQDALYSQRAYDILGSLGFTKKDKKKFKIGQLTKIAVNYQSALQGDPGSLYAIKKAVVKAGADVTKLVPIMGNYALTPLEQEIVPTSTANLPVQTSPLSVSALTAGLGGSSSTLVIAALAGAGLFLIAGGKKKGKRKRK